MLCAYQNAQNHILWLDFMKPNKAELSTKNLLLGLLGLNDMLIMNFLQNVVSNQKVHRYPFSFSVTSAFALTKSY